MKPAIPVRTPGAMTSSLPEPAATPAEDAPPPPPGWEGILQPGERILWQGRPDARPDFSLLLSTRTLFGLFFAGFAVVWIGTAASMLWAPGTRMPAPAFFRLLFPAFGIPFVIVGLGLAFGPVWRDWRARRAAWYTLTDRTAFVATASLGQRRLDRYPLDAALNPSLIDDDPGSILFSAAPATSGPAPGWTFGTGRSTFRRGSDSLALPTRPAGFHRIPEARRVYGLLTEALANRQRTP